MTYLLHPFKLYAAIMARRAYYAANQLAKQIDTITHARLAS